jgi:hypothetical protein
VSLKGKSTVEKKKRILTESERLFFFFLRILAVNRVPGCTSTCTKPWVQALIQGGREKEREGGKEGGRKGGREISTTGPFLHRSKSCLKDGILPM